MKKAVIQAQPCSPTPVCCEMSNPSGGNALLAWTTPPEPQQPSHPHLQGVCWDLPRDSQLSSSFAAFTREIFPLPALDQLGPSPELGPLGSQRVPGVGTWALCALPTLMCGNRGDMNLSI